MTKDEIKNLSTEKLLLGVNYQSLRSCKNDENND